MPFGSALLYRPQIHLAGLTHHAHHQFHLFLWNGGGVYSSIQGLDPPHAFDQTIDLDKYLDH